MAAAGAAYLGANYIAPDTVEEAKQFFKDAKQQYLEPMKQQFKEMLPTGVSVDVNPSFTDPTLTSTLDLSALSRHLRGSAGATIGTEGLLGNIDARVDMGKGVTGEVNYDPQGVNVGATYNRGGFTGVGNYGPQGGSVGATYDGGGFTGAVDYGTQGGSVGANYNKGGFTAGVSAPIEHTAGVSGMLANITASLRYTGKF